MAMNSGGHHEGGRRTRINIEVSKNLVASTATRKLLQPKKVATMVALYLVKENLYFALA
jgi:hypothetical protein